MAQKAGRARREAVGAGLEDNNQVANIAVRQLDLVGQEVEGRAQTADDADGFVRLLAHAVADRNGVIAPDDLTEIAGRRELMVEAAIGHQEYLAARYFAVDHPRDVDSSFADDISAELH